MKIATWNVNSLRVRLPQVLNWLEQVQPDVLALQETKLADDQFPVEVLREAGWHVAYNGQKTYNGVALITRREATDIVTDLPGLSDPQRRVLGATVDGVRILNLYVPNGSAVGSDKYAYKLEWLEHLVGFVEAERARQDRLAVVGDFNIAPADADVHDPVAWEGKVLCSVPEREALARVLDHGLVDTFRLFEQPEHSFSWWDYRLNGFRRNLGLRIDLILACEGLRPCCRTSTVDIEPRRNERPSDHAPAVAEFDLSSAVAA